MKTCYKCKIERKTKEKKCKCGETLVLNTPNAVKSLRALKQSK